jgi:alpha-galactosidase
MQYGVNKTTGDHRKHLMEMRLRTIQRLAAGEEQIKWLKSPEEFTFVMEGILKNEPVQAIINMPNQGQIENLPTGAVVEIFATVDANGIRPKASGKLPETMAAWARLHLQVIDFTVRAGLEGSRPLLLEALSLDPLCQQLDFREISSLADDILRATRKWLPRFN